MSSRSLLKLIISSAALVVALETSVWASSVEPRLLFAGDILLAREVQREIESKGGLSPWSDFKEFSKADWVVGNLEGSVGDPKDCVGKDLLLCFAIPKKNIQYLKQAGFSAIGIENNHSADVGDVGRATTKSEITDAGLAALNFENSPGFLRLSGHTIAFVALSNVKGVDQKNVEVPSNLLRQKLRLAKNLADWVVVYIHWGVELADWSQPKQHEMAEWLISEGADLIIGHHPHVVQDPECVNGKPVFFSLGNHVFDQKYPETKSGMIADCKIKSGSLSCSSLRTVTSAGTSFPRVDSKSLLKSEKIANCKVSSRAPIEINGYKIRPKAEDRQFVDGEIILEGKKKGSKNWTLVAKKLLSLEPGKIQNKKKDPTFLFTLEKHRSNIDQEIGPRPYVYDVTPTGLVAKWRGSALAWPLIDGTLIHSNVGKDYLCALHRKDSFLILDPASTEMRAAVYEWNGFGFAGVQESSLVKACEAKF